MEWATQNPRFFPNLLIGDHYFTMKVFSFLQEIMKPLWIEFHYLISRKRYIFTTLNLVSSFVTWKGWRRSFPGPLPCLAFYLLLSYKSPIKKVIVILRCYFDPRFTCSNVTTLWRKVQFRTIGSVSDRCAGDATNKHSVSQQASELHRGQTYFAVMILLNFSKQIHADVRKGLQKDICNKRSSELDKSHTCYWLEGGGDMREETSKYLNSHWG